ncbi:MAG TPA: MGMT family protein [Streptosporangiaceae bacterium]
MNRREARPRGSERRRGTRAAEKEIGDFASRVLDVAESIPPGRVLSYGDIAEYVGEGGPRQGGRVMALWGGAVPWWRVVHADGSILVGHETEALRHYRREGTPMRKGAGGAPGRLDMRKARWPGETNLT